MTHNYKMIISYDGTQYQGWQIQPNGVTIQEIIQKKLSIILRQQISVIGSGRTDTGVHAIGQTANFHYEAKVDLFRLKGSLNGLLPADIRVIDICEVAINFHSQYSALKKTYHYNLQLGKVHNPFNRLYSYHVKTKIDVDLLKEAAKLFLGTHDFSAFANENRTGSAAHDPVRTIYRIDFVDLEDGLRIEYEADGFLYRMVRNITGTLLDIAMGKRKISDISMLFEKKDRRLAGQSAPPQGLFLFKVDYPIDLLTF